MKGHFQINLLINLVMRCLMHVDSIQEILDADDTPLRDRSGQMMTRDIVQFVPFREVMKKAGPSGNIVRTHPLVSQSHVVFTVLLSNSDMHMCIIFNCQV